MTKLTDMPIEIPELLKDDLSVALNYYLHHILEPYEPSSFYDPEDPEYEKSLKDTEVRIQRTKRLMEIFGIEEEPR